MQRRPHILFAWELGENYGHASKIVEVARALGDRARITVAAQNPAAFRTLASGLDMRLGPAPFQPFQAPDDPGAAALSYSDNLSNLGWGQQRSLMRLVENWRALFTRESPDILVTQAAPTALLAARGLGFGTAILGSGFDLPPRTSPMPPFLHWTKDETGQRAHVLAVREAGVLTRANGVLARLGAPNLAVLSDLHRADRTYLATLPELDQYGPRNRFEPDHPPYLGQLFTLSQGVEKDWPRARKGKRVLAYLRPNSTLGAVALDGLAQIGQTHDILLAAPGISATQHQRLTLAGIDVTDGPLKLEGLLVGADIGISHASSGTAAAFLMAGIPQLGLPSHAEQAMVAYALSSKKLGLGLGGAFTSQHFVAHVNKLIKSDDISRSAKETAYRISLNSSYAHPAETIADDLLRLSKEF